jgi:hypothetical protein
MAHAGGRPPKLTPKQRKEVLDAFSSYIERTPDPTVVGFCANEPICFKYLITRHNIEDWSEFSALQKYCIQKQESYLLMAGGAGRYNPTMAIFRLKQPQHGYRDRTEQDITTGGDKLAPVLVRFISDETDADNTDTEGV